MKAVHITGLGLIVGALAAGTLVAIVAFQWQAATYPERSAPAVVAQAAPASGTPASASASSASKEGTTAPAGTVDLTKARALFTQKCAGCHTIGKGRSVGPDLKGVTAERPRDWLVDFVVAPDKVIASGDPYAQQLVKQYGGLQMPNLGIPRADVETLLAYIEAESR